MDSSNFGTIIIVPAVPQVLEEFKTNNSLYSTIIVSIWELGEGFGPFLVGPLSELYGRMPIYHAGNLLFIVCSVASALSTNISMLVAFRFLNGFVITASTLGPSIIGDLFLPDNRGKAMATAIALPLIGPFVAPILGSVIADSLGWRWTIWVVTIAVGAITCLSLAVFRETYPTKILEKRAERLRRETGNLYHRSRHQIKGDILFARSMTRPMRIMFKSPIVFIISFYTALTYGLSYLILTTLTTVMEDNYRFNEGNVGYLFVGRGISRPPSVGLPLLTSLSHWKYTGNDFVRLGLRPLYEVQERQKWRIKSRRPVILDGPWFCGPSPWLVSLRVVSTETSSLDYSDNWHNYSGFQHATDNFANRELSR